MRKWKFALGTIFEIEAETFEEAEKKALDFDPPSLELVSMD